MEIICKLLDEDGLVAYLEYFDFKKINNISAENSQIKITLDGEEYVMAFPYEEENGNTFRIRSFISLRVSEYILAAYIKNIEVLDISEFVNESATLFDKLIDDKKEKEKLFEERKKMAENGLSFPEYEFMEGALSIKKNVKGPGMSKFSEGGN